MKLSIEWHLTSIKSKKNHDFLEFLKAFFNPCSDERTSYLQSESLLLAYHDVKVRIVSWSLEWDKDALELFLSQIKDSSRWQVKKLMQKSVGDVWLSPCGQRKISVTKWNIPRTIILATSFHHQHLFRLKKERKLLYVAPVIQVCQIFFLHLCRSNESGSSSIHIIPRIC